MSDSTKSNNIDQLDAGSARWQLATRYNPVTDEHYPLAISRDWTHQLIHEGRVFQLSGRITGLGAGATAYLHGLTDSSVVHFRAASLVADGAPIDVVFYGASTVSANGTEIFGKNKERSTSDTHTLRVFTGPTVTDVGTALEYGFLPQVGSGKSGGNAELFQSEWILDSGTSYLIAVTNNDSVSIDINYNFLWYEV
jgi:hypothetical protein